MQPTLISSAITAERLLPENENQWQLDRSRAVFPNGVYSAIDKDGNIEYIGGGTNGGSFAALITSPDGLALTANPIGGVGPFTYLWGVKSKFINGTDIAFTGPTNAAVANIDNRSASFDGTVTVLITDSFGRNSTAYWHTRKDVVIP